MRVKARIRTGQTPEIGVAKWHFWPPTLLSLPASSAIDRRFKRAFGRGLLAVDPFFRLFAVLRGPRAGTEPAATRFASVESIITLRSARGKNGNYFLEGVGQIGQKRGVNRGFRPAN